MTSRIDWSLFTDEELAKIGLAREGAGVRTSTELARRAAEVEGKPKTAKNSPFLYRVKGRKTPTGCGEIGGAR